MINTTGNQGFDIFIMQSDENRQKVINLLYQGYDLESILDYYRLNISDFTTLDWENLQHIAFQLRY